MLLVGDRKGIQCIKYLLNNLCLFSSNKLVMLKCCWLLLRRHYWSVSVHYTDWCCFLGVPRPSATAEETLLICQCTLCWLVLFLRCTQTQCVSSLLEFQLISCWQILTALVDLRPLLSSVVERKLKLKLKLNDIALHDKSSQSYEASLAVWDHTVLPATRHKWTLLCILLCRWKFSS